MRKALATADKNLAIDRPAGTASQHGGSPAALGVTNWLCLAATPTFVAMALLTLFNPADMICAEPGPASVLDGMAPMYLLMSAFHLVPWLRLMSAR